MIPVLICIFLAMHCMLLGAHAGETEPLPVKPAAISESDKKAIADCIAAFHSDDYNIRDNASIKLNAMGAAMLPELKAALRSNNEPEVAHRLGKVIENLEAEIQKAKFAAGMTTLASGLRYKILAEGTGAKPSAADTITCHYVGKLEDGKVFDSSYARNEPAEFPVSGVIAGWVEALQMMKVGAKWVLIIPPKLAYGDAGTPPAIPPNATLIFEVELLSIKETK